VIEKGEYGKVKNRIYGGNEPRRFFVLRGEINGWEVVVVS